MIDPRDSHAVRSESLPLRRTKIVPPPAVQITGSAEKSGAAGERKQKAQRAPDHRCHRGQAPLRKSGTVEMRAPPRPRPRRTALIAIALRRRMCFSELINILDVHGNTRLYVATFPYSQEGDASLSCNVAPSRRGSSLDASPDETALPAETSHTAVSFSRIDKRVPHILRTE